MPDESIDFRFEEDDTGEIQIIESGDQEVEDLVEDITYTPTQDVIQNMDDFTQGVKQGDLHIEEELIMDSMPVDPLRSAAGLDSSIEDSEDLLEKVQAMKIGSWVEFRLPGENNLNAKLSWKSNVTGKYVFVNRHGEKVRNMTLPGMVTELSAGSVKLIESVSVFDRAINSLMSGLTH